MKKIFFIASTLLLSSCVSDVLDKKPVGRELSSTYFQNEYNAILASNALYDPIQREEGYVRGFYTIGECRADLTKVAGGSSSDQLQGQLIAKFQQLADNNYLNGIYKWSFVGIQRCNTILENVNYSESYKKSIPGIRGQAYFMRAFYYADLVRIFGPVQLVTASVGADNLSLGNRTEDDDAVGNKQVEKIYKQIIQDLDSASVLLPAEWGASDKGRATKGAAYGFLCRTYMYVASNDQIFVGDKSVYWKKAIEAANSVMNDGVHSLLPIYHNVFASSNENNSESLFEVQAVDGADADFRAEGMIRALDQMYRYIQDSSGNASGTLGYGLNSPTLAYVKMYDVENKDGSMGYVIPTDPVKSTTPAKLKDAKKDWDPRLDLIAKPEDSIWYETTATPDQWKSFYYDQWKWGIGEPFYGRKTELQWDERTGKGGQSSFRNWIYCRLAEIVLYKAEAALKIGDQSTALECVNIIRSRARKSKIQKIAVENKHAVIKEVKEGKYPLNLSAVTMDDIIKERALELGTEGVRFFDLVRTGYASKLLASIEIRESISPYGKEYTTFNRKYSSRDAVLQIPVSVVIEGQGKVKQNSGY